MKFRLRKNPVLRRKDQKGAALVTVVLLLTLLLSVAGAIIMVTVLSNTTTVDLVAEKQAYDAAEAGMQLALNVLRGNNPGEAVSFKDAATRSTSNKGDDWFPQARLSKWLDYTYPAAQPDRIPLTTPYDPYSGLAYSVTVSAPDAVSIVSPPNSFFKKVDGPVVKLESAIKPPRPGWHPWHCGHCKWDYEHCTVYNPPNNGTNRADGNGCRHKHCRGQVGPDGYERLIVRVVGYGARGARKQLELMVNRVLFDYDGDSLLLIRGSRFGGDLTFNINGSPKTVFDGGDQVAFGLTNSSDQTLLDSVISEKDKVSISGKGDDYEVYPLEDLSPWLASADEARSLLRDLELDAKLRNRWFTSYPTGSAGSDSNPQLTFVRGDATLSSDGAGILVVTGELKLTSDRKFKGIVLLLEGGMLRVTGGKATIEGSTVISRFGGSGDFQGPIINITSGQTTFKNNIDRVQAALTTVNMAVQGVRQN